MNRTLFPWKKQALRAGVAAGCCDVCGEKRPDYGVNHSYLVGQMGLTSYVQNLKNDGDETGYRATAWRERCRAWLGLLSFPVVPLCVLRRRVVGFLQTESAGLRRSTCGCGELAPLHYEGLKQVRMCYIIGHVTRTRHLWHARFRSYPLLLFSIHFSLHVRYYTQIVQS